MERIAVREPVLPAEAGIITLGFVGALAIAGGVLVLAAAARTR